MMAIMYVCRASSLNDYAFNFKANSALGRPKMWSRLRFELRGYNIPEQTEITCDVTSVT